MKRMQGGMSMVVAIFLITVIASLAAFAVSVGAATSETENLQLQTDRAAAAARAGAEWGAYRALVSTNCPSSSTAQTFNLNQSALRGFRVTVFCTQVGSTPRPIFEINSFAQRGNFGAGGYASRRVITRVW
jgi:MSHA biogenesis protein MshP